MGKVASEFLPPLQNALAQRKEWLQETRLPLLKEDVRNLRLRFESLVGTLVKKGLLREDPYEYDGRPTCIAVPADPPIPEASEADELASRISLYRLQLDFLVDSFPFTLAALDLPGVKEVLALLAFIDWAGFGESSASPMTRALANAVTTVRVGQDTVSARILTECHAHIERLLREIRCRLAEVEAWDREAWKVKVREKALPCAALQTFGGKADREAVIEGIHRAFDQALPDEEWRPELVQEILAEERTEDGAVRRERLLRSLALPQPEPVKVDDSVVRRACLMEGVRGITRAGTDIGFAESVLIANEHELEKRTLGVLQRLRRWLQKLMGRMDDRFYDIEVKDNPTAEPRTESIDFLRFIVDLREMRGMLAELAEEGSSEHARILVMTDVQLCEFLDWQLRQLRHLHRRMESLNAFFQLKAVRARTGAVRSIRVELLALENGIQRADKARRECLEKLEEEALLNPDRVDGLELPGVED